MVSDKESYDRLTGKLKALSDRHPDLEHSITVIHVSQQALICSHESEKKLLMLVQSKERAMLETQQNKHIYDRQLWVKRSHDSGGEDEEDQDQDGIPGETYFEWLCRTERI